MLQTDYPELIVPLSRDGGTCPSELHPTDPVFKSMVTLLGQYRPTHIFTLTYGKRVGYGRRMHFFNEWIDSLEWMQRRPMGWVRADEMKLWSGCGRPEIPEHHHGLLYQADHLSCRDAENIWHSIAGDALVQRYDPARNGIAYVLKRGLHIGEWDLGGMKAFRNIAAGAGLLHQH